MKTVIVCESLFGNTEVIAGLVAHGIRQAGGEVDLIEVGKAFAEPPDLSRCDLLVVAAPTHALTLSRPESRAQAVAQGGDPRREKIGVREWLGTFSTALPDPAPLVVVFDTKVTKARHWPGSAARRAARSLRKDGFRVVDCVNFYVDGIAGPLSPGETARAERWGAGLPERVRSIVRPSNGTAGNHA